MTWIALTYRCRALTCALVYLTMAWGSRGALAQAVSGENLADQSHVASNVIYVFGILVPIAILIGRYAVKRQRQTVLQGLRDALNKSTGRDAALIPSFEFALQKYDLDGDKKLSSKMTEVMFYTGTSLIFVVLSLAGFVLLVNPAPADHWKAVRLILVGIQANSLSASSTSENYQQMTGAVIAFAFLGSYIWSIQYLIRRIANFDLSPMSFLRVSAQVILACGTAAVVRHFLPTPTDAAGIAEAVIVLGAFLIGFFPNAGLEYLMQKVPQLRLKQLDPDAAAAFRVMPVEMIDGIDSQVSFRLGEREVVDVQNLAAENPIILCAETPYPLLEIVDWIAQAQLALEVGPKAYRRLRDLGMRTIFALEKASSDEQLAGAALKILYEQEGDRPKTLAARLDAMKANLHVARLQQIYDIVHEALNAGPPAARPGADPDAAPSAATVVAPPARHDEPEPDQIGAGKVLSFDR